MEPRFPLGKIVTTPGSLGLGVDLKPYLRRHHCGDWGELDDEDKETNEDALEQGARLLSCYQEVARKLPRYPTTPATLIGRLARSVDHPGLGSLLLADALGRIFASTDQVASAVVVVEAKDGNAAAFYRKHGFLDFPQEKRKLFLPMKTVAAAVGKSR
jgi:hypothetical protein